MRYFVVLLYVNFRVSSWAQTPGVPKKCKHMTCIRPLSSVCIITIWIVFSFLKICTHFLRTLCTDTSVIENQSFMFLGRGEEQKWYYWTSSSVLVNWSLPKKLRPQNKDLPHTSMFQKTYCRFQRWFPRRNSTQPWEVIAAELEGRCTLRWQWGQHSWANTSSDTLFNI